MVANAAPQAGPTRRPVALAPDPDGIPAVLKARKQWVTHRPDGEREKVPCSVATGQPVNYRDPHLLGASDEAVNKAAERGHAGVGFAIFAGDPFTFVDVDHCVRDDGTIAPIVAHTLRRLGTYVEYSINDGLHAVIKARKPVDDCTFWLEDPTSHERFKVEIWDRDRFVAMTGRTPDGMPTTVGENQRGLDTLIAGLAGRQAPATSNGHRPPPSQASSIDDDMAIGVACNLPDADGATFKRLFEHGAEREHHSEEDFQFFKILGKVTQDYDQIKRIFGRSAVMREKVARRADYHIGRALADLALETCCEQDAPDQDAPPCSAEADVSALKQQLAARTAECEQWKRAYAMLVAVLFNLLRWKKAYACLRALLMTPALNESQKKVLVHHLGLHGVTVGPGMPTGVWWSYLTEEQMQASGVGEKSYRGANAVLEELGLFERERHEPAAPAPRSAHDAEGVDEQAPSVGRPYDKWRPVPAGVERFMADLEAGRQPEPTPRQEAEREKRREKERKEKAAQQAREARQRQETAALRQVAYERDQAQREAEERRRALEEAQQVIAVHQRSETLACRGCGVKIDPEQLRCEECCQREREQAAGHRPADGNGHQLVVDSTALEPFPRVPPGGGEFVVDVTNNSAGGEDAEHRTLWPPGDPDAPAAGASELFAAPAPCPTGGRCSDCKQPIAKAYGRCAYCRGAEYLRLGLEESP